MYRKEWTRVDMTGRSRIARFVNWISPEEEGQQVDWCLFYNKQLTHDVIEQCSDDRSFFPKTGRWLL